MDSSIYWFWKKTVSKKKEKKKERESHKKGKTEKIKNKNKKESLKKAGKATIGFGPAVHTLYNCAMSTE